jgi:hypothetical protein
MLQQSMFRGSCQLLEYQCFGRLHNVFNKDDDDMQAHVTVPSMDSAVR